MQLIPVIDLLDGHAVRAERGLRESYLPVRSALAATSEPVAIARALLAACAAKQVPLGGAAKQVPLGGAAKQVPQEGGVTTLYVADLGAILQRGAHAATLAALIASLPDVAIWVDAGFDSYAAMRAYFDAVADAAPLADASRNVAAAGDACSAAQWRTRIVPVFGTESLREPAALRDAERDGFAPILSLDRRAGRSLSAIEALEDLPDHWPQRVISMTLDHVGSYAGPDLVTLARLRERARHGTQLIGAGGIRHRDDLRLAQASGAHAWLVASALHDRRLDEPATA
ncbi:MAG TPA: HisA/HisF-related TIM barrel protein [Paraburkholderia sp.]|jgi:phosphoribosylformimino-5-aminoimidazole carboxamide ribotide isomerase